MDFAPVYLVQRFFYRIGSFFYHWYVGGSRAIGNKFMLTIEAIDQSFAVKITLQHFFEPLYKDYSVVGRVVGVVFRTGRILIGAAVYLFVAAIFTVIYIIWLVIPPTILWYIVTGKTYVTVKL